MSSYANSPVKVVDQALAPTLFEALKRYAHNAAFDDVVNPGDGVEYPGICAEIPMWIEVSIRTAIADCIGVDYRDVHIHLQFFRVTTKHTDEAPHGAHNDAIHGKYSAFFYVNDVPPELGKPAGTSLLTHIATGLNAQPQRVEEWDAWDRDTNTYDAWRVDEMVQWEPNRLAVYPADRMHRAEPPEGWGEGVGDGRLVLITFFSC